MVEQAARGGDNDIRSCFQIFNLFAVSHPSMQQGCQQVCSFSVSVKGFFHLLGQFPGRFEDEAAQGAVPFEQGKDGQGKGRRFTRAGMGSADNIPPAQDQRYGLGLHRGGFFVALFYDGAKNCFAQSKAGKIFRLLQVQ